MTLEQIIDKHFDEIFKEILDLGEDNIYDLTIEYKSLADGKTIKRSWLDREERLREYNHV